MSSELAALIGQIHELYGPGLDMWTSRELGVTIAKPWNVNIRGEGKTAIEACKALIKKGEDELLGHHQSPGCDGEKRAQDFAEMG